MKYIISIITLSLIVLVGCTDKFEEFNTDIKNPGIVDGEALFSNAQKYMTDQISNTNVNRNIFKLMSQYWTETTYTEEANYDLLNRNIPQNLFRYYYRRTLYDFQEASHLIEASEGDDEAVKTNKLMIIEVLNVFCYQRLVDVFGMIPYDEALDIDNLYPSYQAGEEIYADMIGRLDDALSKLDVDADSYGSVDLIYGGDVEAWVKFANTLKVRLGIAIADYDAELAKSTVESAYAGAFGSAVDNCYFQYLTSAPNFNPLYEDLVKSGRHDFVAANTFVDMLHDLNDPRMYDFFANPVDFPFVSVDDVLQDTTISSDDRVGLSLVYPDGSVIYKTTPITLEPNGVDKGVQLIYGGQYGYNSTYSRHSHPAARIEEATFEGILLTYSELMFYLAEAAERGYAVEKSAEEYYNEGIRASFAYWETEGVDDYLANPQVAYSTASDNWKEKIGVQSWIAAYTRGLLGYNTWRRLDYPIFNIAEAIETYDEIPLRFTFPVNEQTLNRVEYDKASQAIGGDLISTPIFWDKH